MALTKYRLGDLIELTEQVNSNLEYGADSVMGMTITKQIIPTKADTKNADLSKYLIVYPNEFIYNPRTHGKKIGLGFNNTDKAFLISWNNIAFRIKDSAKRIISPEYLFMHFNRDEWDRAACYHSWGSSTEVFSWDALCDMEFDLPPIEIQQKYVDIYNAMLANQKAYEQGLDDLKLTCDAYIENLRRKMPCEIIGQYLTETRIKNEDELVLSNKAVSNTKVFVDAKDAIVSGVDTKNYLIVNHNDFAYNTVTTRNGDKLSIALNYDDKCLVSPLYTTFEVDEKRLSAEYLGLWFNRSEYDRFSRFNSWGSARELFSFETLSETRIPIPNIQIQKSIADVYNTYIKRRKLNEQLKLQIKNICPILIKGSLQEANQ